MSKQKAKREEEKSALGPRKRGESLFVIAEVLEAARAGALKTQIMDKAKISRSQLDAYLKLLLKAKLLEAITRNEKTFYKTSTKGEGYLRDLANLLKKLGLQTPPKSFRTPR